VSFGGMFRAQRLLLDPERPLEQGYRLVVLALVKPEPAVVGDGFGHGRMVRAQGLFRLAVSALFPVQVSQRIKDFADLGVAGSLGVLPNLQGALVKRPRFLEVPGLAVSIGQPFQGLGQFRVALAEPSFSVIDRLFEIRNRLGEFFHLLKRLSLHHGIPEVARLRMLTKMSQEQGGKDRQKNKPLHTETPPGHDILRWTGNFALF